MSVPRVEPVVLAHRVVQEPEAEREERIAAAQPRQLDPRVRDPLPVPLAMERRVESAAALPHGGEKRLEVEAGNRWLAGGLRRAVEPELLPAPHRDPDGEQEDDRHERGVEGVHPVADVAAAAGQERLDRAGTASANGQAVLRQYGQAPTRLATNVRT